MTNNKNEQKLGVSLATDLIALESSCLDCLSKPDKCKFSINKPKMLRGGTMYYFDATNEKWITLRETAEYKKRRKLVRDCWIGVAACMLFVPAAYAIILAIGATFLSFMFLDEVEYAFMKCAKR